MVGFYTALAKGYYREEGLDLSIVPGGPFAVADKQSGRRCSAVSAWIRPTTYWKRWLTASR